MIAINNYANDKNIDDDDFYMASRKKVAILSQLQYVTYNTGSVPPRSCNLRTLIMRNCGRSLPKT